MGQARQKERKRERERERNTPKIEPTQSLLD